MIAEPVILFALIGALGVGSQWLAWRLQLPAIVLMLAAGLIAGPGLGLMDPKAQLGELYSPVIAIAVAVILFEGGITLNARALGGAAPGLKRLVYVGAPLGWLTFTLAAHYVGGLSLPVAAVFGGILVVTGPTVVTPLLRQARMAPRPASILRWEAIVNDPIGALFAVFAFEAAVVIAAGAKAGDAVIHLVVGVVVALIVGYISGRAVVIAFQRGWAPEYMKAPILLAAVLATYAATDAVLHESGLLAVTVMGAVIGNARLASLTELIRFKEHMTVLLVSGVFILLAASMDVGLIAELSVGAIAFVAVVIFIARPLVVGLSLVGTDLSIKERAILGWIAPRGVVAVAISGFFGARLVELGYADGAMLAPIAFLLVAATVVLHGFSIGPLARALGLTSSQPPGAIIVGGSAFAAGLAEAIREAGAPALVADRNWYSLRTARAKELPTFHGEILSEAFEHQIDVAGFGHLIAATDNDDYNALICTDFGPEFGRGKVYQIARHEGAPTDADLPATLGGRGFAGGLAHEALEARLKAGWRFARTKLTEDFGLDQYRDTRPDALPILVQRGGGALEFLRSDRDLAAGPGDAMISLVPPEHAAA